MVRASLQDELIRATKADGGDHLIDLVLAEARECVNIYSVDDDNDEDDKAASPPPGGSRLGGLPDLPEGVEWPAGVDEAGKPWRYADFLIQLNFAEIPAIDGLRLPPHGRLWLFTRAWRRPEALLAVIHESSGAVPVTLRDAPTQKEWAVFPTFDLEQDRPITTGTASLRFEVGASLPFGKDSFDHAFVGSPRVRNHLYDTFMPAERQGRIGGHALDPSEGHDHRLNAELAQRGKRNYLYPFTCQTIAELDQVIPNLPSFLSKKQDYVDKLKTQLKTLRPRVAWIEEHADELNEWQPFLCIHENGFIGLDWGGNAISLWTFIRSTDLAAANFTGLVSESVL